MSGKIRIILGYHDHLSPGSAGGDFEERYNAVLKPFVTLLNGNPDIPAVLHFSGALLERLEKEKPEFFLLVSDLVARRQAELLGGGFYEPLLPFLPLADKIGQVEMLTTYIRRHFGKKPQGCCLSFGAWERSLAGVLHSCGMAYTFLSAGQFRSAGIEEADVYSPKITEDQGKPIAVFPVFSSLDLLDAPDGGKEQRIAAVFPRFSTDRAGEQLSLFFEQLRSAAGEKKLELTLPGKALKIFGPLKRAYFHCSLDDELVNPGSAGQNNSPPGRFLIHCAEANALYVKMFFTHALVNQLRGDKSRKQAAREELWKAQGADLFCGTGGQGIRHAPLRKSAYQALISAERITREKGNFRPSLLVFDLDLDGQAEYLFQDKSLNYYVRAEGASVFELDYLPKNWNYLDTFSSSYRRCAFMDRLLEPDALEGRDAEYVLNGGGNGRFCGEELYEASADKQRNRAVFRLHPGKDMPFGGIEIEKIFQLEKDMLSLSYTLTNRDSTAKAFLFTPQTDLSFAGPAEYSVHAGSSGGASENMPLRNIMAFEAADTNNKTIISFSSEAVFDLYWFPVFESGIYESSCFFPLFDVRLESGQSWSTVIRLSVAPAKR